MTGSGRNDIWQAGRVFAGFLVWALPLCAQAEPPTGYLRATLEPEMRIATHEVVDLDGDGREELVLIGIDGEVSIRVQRDGMGEPGPSGATLTLPRPDHSVVAFADVTRDGRAELVVFDDRGVHAFAITADGTFASEPLVLVDRSRMRIRVGRPTFAAIVRDLNGDELPDLVLPIFDTCDLWLHRGAADGAPRFELAQSVAVPVSHRTEDRATNLVDVLVNRVRVPRLDMADVNGDGRPDLRTRDGDVRRFFLQAEDGRFAEKPIQVDLSMFRDTTPEAEFELGETLVFEDEQQMQSGDLNADGIPDYVIAHRRKVWSFLGTKAGPQFQRADTRVVAEDVSVLLLMHLDDDERDDLLVIKVDAPTAAELALGLVSSIDVPVHCLGYRTTEDGTFERKATWKRTLTVRIPSLTRILGQATDLVESFMSVLSKLRWSTVGDFDGDGRRDLALVTEDDEALELWLSPKSVPREGREVDAWLRDIFFEDPDTVFDVDRILKLAARIFDARTSSMTGDRAPDARFALPKRQGSIVVDLFPADFDGDGRADTVLVTESEALRGDRRFDVVEWR